MEDEEIEKEVIKHNKELNLLVTIRNLISLICFTILAIVFNKWWIVFFALIFFSYVDREDKD